MAVTLVRPSADLQLLVRHFRLADTHITGEAVRWPLTARSDQFIEFYLADPYRVTSFGGGPARTVAPIVVLGSQTKRNEDLVLQGTLRVFTIHFQPAGFHDLFGVPMRELTDQAFSATDVIGSEIVHLHERLQEVRGDHEKVALAESWLRARVRGPTARDPVHGAAHTILASHGQANVSSVARTVGLSTRQLERRFLQQVGVSPKMLGRLARLEHALRLRRNLSDASWARIAVEAGYYDQMHLVKDFHALAGESPSHFEEATKAAGSRLRWE